jgi:tRNA(Arg) A34 adenosine deaminase TadA
MNDSFEVGTIGNAEQVARLAATQAIIAHLQGTFGVGGILVHNETREVVCVVHNNVLKPAADNTFFLPFDPTAHGERQLVDWYYDNREHKQLDLPEAFTIVTSLDPCAMCAGALLRTGFNVGISAYDTYAGINYDRNFTFPSVPQECIATAKAHFGYYGVEGVAARAYQGSRSILFSGDNITSPTLLLSQSIFEISVNNARLVSNAGGLNPLHLGDPNFLPPDSPVRRALSKAYSKALSVRCRDPRLPGSELAEPLIEVAKTSHRLGGTLNSAAIIDPFGNLLLCSGSAEHHSPIRTAFMELVRTYAGIRWRLMNDSDPTVREEAQNALTHPKYGTLVTLFAPNPHSPVGLMEMGAYGSTMEGSIPQAFPSNLQYVLFGDDTSPEQIAEFAMRLPPFYKKEVEVAPVQVLSMALVAACGKALRDVA